jgi:hypothetical protein
MTLQFSPWDVKKAIIPISIHTVAASYISGIYKFALTLCHF